MSRFTSVFSARRGALRIFSAGLVASLAALMVQALPAQAATATINSVSFKAPVFNSYSHTTGGGAFNDGSVTYDKGELLGTDYKCGDIASFMLELNTSATPTKQPAPYKAEIKLTYTWDATGQSGTSLTPLTSASHLKVNTGQILNTYNGGSSALGTGTGGTDGGMNTAGAAAAVATSPAPVVTNSGAAWPNSAASGDEFKSGATSAVTFTVENIQAGANVVVRSDAVIHCKPNATPTGNMQAALSYVTVTSPGAAENISAGNQTVNFRGVGNLAGLGSSLSVTKSISTNGTDCTSTVAVRTYSTSPQTVLYCYTVTNTGNNDVTNVVLTDDNAGTAAAVTVPLKVGTASATSPVTLLVGQSATGTYSHTYSSAGTYTNIATVSSSAPTVTASATATLGQTSTLAITKTQTSGAPTKVGDVITYTLNISDTNNSSAVDEVIDLNASSLSCPGSTSTAYSPSGFRATSVNLSGGSHTVTCTATHVVTSADVTAGQVSNFATARKNTVTATSNTVVTPIAPAPTPVYDMSIVKTQTSTILPAAANDTIVYNILVTNTGNTALTNVNLVDGLSNTTVTNCKYQTAGTPAVASFPIATFAVGSSFACTATHTVQSGELNSTITNTATASATQTLVTSGTTSVSSSVNTVVGAQPHMSVLKIQATGNPPARLNAVLTYGISFYNDGNVTLTNVQATDPNATTFTNCKVGTTPWTNGGSLLAGTQIDCDATHTVSQADLNAGSFTNVAYMTASYNSTPLNAQSQDVVSIGALSITKSRTDNLGSSLTPGSNVTYSVVVRNTGTVALTNVAVVEPAGFTVNCPSTTIAIGASLTCTVSHAVTQAEYDAHSVVNTASVTSDQTDPISSNTVTSPIAKLTIVKSQTAASITTGGNTLTDSVTYSIVVTNTGGVALNNVVVADAGTTLSPNPCSVATLAVNTSLTCTAVHALVAGDVTAHQVVNTASVTSTEVPSTNSNTVTTPIPQAGSFLTIVKTRTDSLGSNLVSGSVVTFSIVVTNTGNTTLNHVVVTDSGTDLTPNPCSATTLAPNATLTCTASHTIGSADMAGHSYSNTAHVVTDEIASTDSNTVVVPIAALTIVKTRTDSLGSSLVEGSSITYSIVVTNTGGVALTNVNVADGNAVIGTCTPSVPAASLAINATITCAATHSVTAAEVAAHHVVNTAAVTTSEIPSTNSNTVSSAIAELTITKSRVGSTAIMAAGDVVTYSIVVTNTGAVAIHSVSVTDGNATLGTCSPAIPTTLAIGGTLTCSATHTVTAGEVTAGHVLNTATVTSTEVPTTNSNQVDTPVNPAVAPTPQPGLSVVKSLVGAVPTKVGDKINYSITATNTGDIALSNVTISDANAVVVNCAATNLATGASLTCTASHTITDADMAAGKVDNVAVASSPTGGLNSTSNIVTVPLTPAPAMTIVKSLSGSAATSVGGTITYSIVVTNTGNVSLLSVQVTDANATIANCSPVAPGTLAVGATMNCSATHVVTDADMLAGKVDNTASATSATGNLSVVSNVVTVPLVRKPAITIVKSVTGAMPNAIGGYVHYSIVVTNSGNVTLHDVQVFDDNATITGCTPTTPAVSLAVGASITCAARHAVTADDVLAGKIINVAYAKTAENVTATSSASGSSNSSGSAAPGTIKANSNETVVNITFKGRSIGSGSGHTIVLGASALKNPKLTQLAFTGDDEPLTSDFGFFAALLAAIVLALGAFRIARR